MHYHYFLIEDVIVLMRLTLLSLSSFFSWFKPFSYKLIPVFLLKKHCLTNKSVPYQNDKKENGLLFLGFFNKNCLYQKCLMFKNVKYCNGFVFSIYVFVDVVERGSVAMHELINFVKLLKSTQTKIHFDATFFEAKKYQ